MNRLQRQILDLLRCCLTDEHAQLDEDFDWGIVGPLGAAHQILPMLYHGAVQSKLSIPEPTRAHLEQAAIRAVFVDQNQLYEIEQIRRCFLEQGIDFMLLKGALLKSLYPRSDMRLMGDVDILIKMEQYDTIRPVMQQLGYQEILESDHELVWDKPGILHVELHKRLIPSYNNDYYAYFGDGWRLAQAGDGSEYHMKDEDEFIYVFTHYAKHYRSAGIGIRHLMDLYVLLQAKPHLNWDYIEAELKKLQLLTFYRNSLETLAVWFDGQEDTQMSDAITDRIFESGSYGTRQNEALWEGVKRTKTTTVDKAKKAKMLRLIFPSLEVLAPQYSVLKKAPYLLPGVWVYRWFLLVFGRRDAIKRRWDDVALMTDDNISAYQRSLNYVGLDFHFQEPTE